MARRMNAEEIFEQYPSPDDSDEKENDESSPIRKRSKRTRSKEESDNRRKLPERSGRAEAIKKLTTNVFSRSTSYDSTSEGLSRIKIESSSETTEGLSRIKFESSSEPASSRESSNEPKLFGHSNLSSFSSSSSTSSTTSSSTSSSSSSSTGSLRFNKAKKKGTPKNQPFLPNLIESEDEFELMPDGRVKITFDNLDPIGCDNGVDSSSDDEEEEFRTPNFFSVCESIIQDAPIVPDSITGVYEVERILLVRQLKKETRYLLKWKGYPLYQMSWAKEKDLTGCPKVKKNFEDRVEVCKKIYNSLQNKEEYKGFKDSYVTSIITEVFVEQNMLEDGLVKIMLSNNFAPLAIENWTRFREAWPDSFTWTVESYFSYPTSVEVEKFEDCEGCNCNICDPVNCPCVQKTITSCGHVRANMDNYIKECHKNCGCSSKCPSKVFRRGRTIPLMLFRTPKCGWSVRTMAPIPARRFVMEYTGLIKTYDECHDIDDQTYLFNCDLPDGTIKYVVDATHHGNESRFVNHNCEPNLNAYSVLGYHNDPALTRIVFFSSRSIEAGEELTFNYFPHELDLKLVDPKEKRICRCGAKTCRGFLL